MKQGFNCEKYIHEQSNHILERISKFNRLYLEFGGKLFDDYHASRVLPGFLPDAKIKMLMQLKNQAEIILAINANDLEKNKIRSDLGISYEQDLFRLIDLFYNAKLKVAGVIITRYQEQARAQKLRKKLEKNKISVAYNYPIDNYPNDIETILSEKGFGKNEYIKTDAKLVVMTAPGPGSGKLACCLSQMYHEHSRGQKVGYAKFETFPIWNLALNHPVNLAYEAATADLNDVNMIDPYHLETYQETAINYNRDVEAFPVLNNLLQKITGETIYHSPTDMGVNRAGFCIEDDEVCCEASKQEIICRYYKQLVASRKDEGSEEIIQKLEVIMSKANVDASSRPIVAIAQNLAQEYDTPVVAIQLSAGEVITGKTSELLHASSACMLNALKHLAGLPDIDLISTNVIEPMLNLKKQYFSNDPRIHVDEILLALALESTTSDVCKLALKSLKNLNLCEAHSTVILSEEERRCYQKLGIRVSEEPYYEQNKKLFHY